MTRARRGVTKYRRYLAELTAKMAASGALMSQDSVGRQEGQTRLPVGAFVLDVAREALVGREGEVRLRPKTYEVLCYLLAHRGRIVTKQELIDAAWGETSVTDDSLVQCHCPSASSPPERCTSPDSCSTPSTSCTLTWP